MKPQSLRRRSYEDTPDYLFRGIALTVFPDRFYSISVDSSEFALIERLVHGTATELDVMSLIYDNVGAFWSLGGNIEGSLGEEHSRDFAEWSTGETLVDQYEVFLAEQAEYPEDTFYPSELGVLLVGKNFGWNPDTQDNASEDSPYGPAGNVWMGNSWLKSGQQVELVSIEYTPSAGETWYRIPTSRVVTV